MTFDRWRMRCLFAVVAVVGVIVCTSPAARAEPDIWPPGASALVDGPAQAWLVADLDTGRILAARNPYAPHAPASTIKVLLAIVALDQLNLNSRIVATRAHTQVECSCVGLQPGGVYTARQLLDALLLVSGNDAANALADMLGGFRVAVAKMNAKAYQLGARSTRTVSPSGLDAPGLDMRTTANDLAVIFRAALRYPAFAQILSQPSAMFPDDSGGHVIENQNELLTRYPGALGGKTGYTDIARHTYVGAAQRDGRRLVVVQLYSGEGGQAYWDQVTRLLDWGFAQQL